MSEDGKFGRGTAGKYQPILDIGMGLLYIGLSGYILISGHFGNFQLTGVLAYGMIALLLVYGAFRIYRGVTEHRRNKEQDL